MRRLALFLLFFLLETGSLPVLASGRGGSGYEMKRSHHVNEQKVALPARSSRHETAGPFCVMQQTSALASEDSELEQKLKTLATGKVKAECESCRVTVECKWMSPLVSNAPPETITGLHFDKAGMPAGYATAKVAFNDAFPSANATVQFYVSVQQRVPVATANIKRGAPVSEPDLTWQWKDISRLNRQPVVSGDYFKDKTAARLIRRGSVFYPSYLLGAKSIRPGDRVTMQYGGEGVQLQIACIARESKGIGQKVRLYSKETGRRYLAKIISEDKIIWVKTL